MSENFVSTTLAKFRASIAKENARSSIFNITRGSLRTAFLAEPAAEVRHALAHSSELEFGAGALTLHDDDASNIDVIVSLDSQVTRDYGMSALYCGLGLVQWTDPRDNRLRTAPLILVPVRAISLGSNGYRIRQVGEPILNEPLIKRIGLPRSAFPDDPLSFKPKKSHEMIKAFSPDAVIGLFSTIRTLLADRLDHALEPSLPQHRLVSALIGRESPDASDFDPKPLDRRAFLPCDTDQNSAMIAVDQGRNIIVHGPPGTGKTQTITNVVATAIGRGRRVLLLSEAPIALQPVIDRLGSSITPKSILDLRPARQAPLSTSHGRVQALAGELEALPSTELPLLTVATAGAYLSAVPAAWSFDLLIIDEASKMRTSYAVPAISRCEQMMIVGDDQQCSPSTILQYSQDGAVTTDGDIDILTAARSAGIATVYLKKHYRSQHPDLISFSNRTFYSCRLIAAPSIHPIGHYGSVRRFVGGVCRSSENQVECEQLVASIIEQKLRDADAEVVVIAATYQQCILIAKTLRSAIPGAYKSVSILHISECQGIECDVAYLSLVYGPDENGSQKNNFGLLAETGGQRLLNVAITRARQRTEVFSSIRTEHLAPRPRTPLSTLCAFLTRHELALQDNEQMFESPMALLLRRNGYEPEAAQNATLVRKDGKFIAAIHHTGLQPDIDDSSQRAQLENSGWTVIGLPASLGESDSLEHEPDIKNMLEALDQLSR